MANPLVFHVCTGRLPTGNLCPAVLWEAVWVWAVSPRGTARNAGQIGWEKTGICWGVWKVYVMGHPR